MAFLSPLQLMKAVAICPDDLRRLAAALSLGGTSDRAREERFLAAVDAYDTSTVNVMLRESICHILQTDDWLEGLSRYCKKFMPTADTDALRDQEIFEFIYDHRDEIDRQLRAAGV